eukprot:m.143428 g.143428  ORF g.143428 m.143428 type:complete len:68 (+) comp14896_c0_seq4:1028-1231(+)
MGVFPMHPSKPSTGGKHFWLQERKGWNMPFSSLNGPLIISATVLEAMNIPIVMKAMFHVVLKLLKVQ